MKKLDIDFEGVNGNAFALLGHFDREAKKAGWTKEERNKIREEATSGDYDHLLQTLISA